ncbi:hypothetical protein AAGG74_18645 [Bacillus mexicanus]|uniref:hypothetical protein n=1 Tax=Bacillus mexicanus TaxID=2834415 RepID=UPI003D2057D0
MKTEKMFEVATRSKFRFPFRGQISVEDLWDLDVQNLDLIFKELNSKLKQQQEESLLNEKTRESKDLETKIEIVKYIVGVKLKEKESKEKEKEKKEKRQKILEIINSKQDDELKDKSIKQLQDMLDKIDE